MSTYVENPMNAAAIAAQRLKEQNDAVDAQLSRDHRDIAARNAAATTETCEKRKE